MKKIFGQVGVSCLALVMFFVIFPAVSDSAPQYVQNLPLAQVVTGSVGEVRDGGPVQVPLITWGGDIATVYGNGNDVTTKKGSIFDQEGLSLKLVKEDVFPKQLEDYVSGKSPYLRGTLGMINMALDVTSRDSRLDPVVFYQMTESGGGDALTVKKGIKTARDLCGKTIAVQAYGPHVDYYTKVIMDACGSLKNTKVKWTNDLVGFEGSTPGAALRSDPSVDAAFVIIPDALALTSGGKVGTGGEDSVKGARILLSTKTANRIIADHYAVRADYFRTHRNEVEKFTHGLLRAEEALRALMKHKESRPSEYQQMISAAASVLMGSPQATSDTDGMYHDAEFVGYRGNVKFFGDSSYLRNFERRTGEIQKSFMAIGLLSKRMTLAHAKWDYNRLKAGLTGVADVEAPKFDKDEIARVIEKKKKEGTLPEAELFWYEVHFEPNQTSFLTTKYDAAFEEVMERSATYGGAVVTIEGHSDPLAYLRAKKECRDRASCENALRQIQQAARTLSKQRADAVQESLISFAKKRGVKLDASQFTTVGYGIGRPKNGMCGDDPCPPKTEREWKDNMRVEFRVIQVEAEASTFKPL